MEIEKMVQEYQCPGCVSGPYPKCYKKDSDSSACEKHCSGTTFSHIGRIFLGMPKGFNRLGSCKTIRILIFDSPGKLYDKFNIPVWKHLDKHGNTLVRGLSPRINWPWIHVFSGNFLNQIDCWIITQKDLDSMD